MSSPAQHPSPERIFDTLLAFQQSAALKAALDLDLFTAIGKDGGSLTSLAKQTQASERGLRILCDYLVIKGFLTKQSGAYGLAPDSAVFLDQRSPAYLGGARHFLLQSSSRPGQRDTRQSDLGGVRA
jgi:hypothetical protein